MTTGNTCPKTAFESEMQGTGAAVVPSTGRSSTSTARSSGSIAPAVVQLPINVGSELSPALFKEFCRIAYERAGIKLREGKEALVAARVAKRQRALGLSEAKDYLEYLKEEGSEEELVKFLDVISTNFTSFFREKEHFRVLHEAVREWIDAGARRIRIWCAACSSGEEPYSIAMTALNALNRRGCNLKILATDISTRMLEVAKKGVYTAQRLEPVSSKMRAQYFAYEGKIGESSEECFEVLPSVRNLVTFSRLNLAAPPFPMKGPMDMVFCRNVMIYFDTRVRQGLITEIERLLKPNGLLVTGHSETLAGLESGFKMVRPSVFQKQAVADA